MFKKDIKIGDIDCRVEGETLEEVCEDTRAALYIVNKYKRDKTEMAKAYPRLKPVYETAVLVNGIFKTTVIASPDSEGSAAAIEEVTKAFKDFKEGGKKKGGRIK